jgi:hypothetical protein
VLRVWYLSAWGAQWPTLDEGGFAVRGKWIRAFTDFKMVWSILDDPAARFVYVALGFRYTHEDAVRDDSGWGGGGWGW